jgi:hypothetical protein
MPARVILDLRYVQITMGCPHVAGTVGSAKWYRNKAIQRK